MTEPENPIIDLLKSSDSPMRTSDFLSRGINRMALSRLERTGEIERVGRGLYRLPHTVSMYADWAVLSSRYPDIVIMTQSAATFHGTTQDLVGSVHIARPSKVIIDPETNERKVDVKSTKIASPVSVRLARLQQTDTHDPYSYGIDTHIIEGIPVRITNLERTLVDMFRFSAMNPSLRKGGHISEESFIVCLERTLQHRDFSVSRLSEYARKAEVRQHLSPLVKSMNHIVSQLPEDDLPTHLGR
jgi:hypothetical protein